MIKDNMQGLYSTVMFRGTPCILNVELLNSENIKWWGIAK